jgi:hypothetical protein
MNRINLWVDRTTRDFELEKKIPNLKPLIRIKGSIIFSSTETPRIAIIDTGAHVSLIPFRFWKDLNIEILAEHYMSGVVPEKKMPVNVSYVVGRLIDREGNESKSIKFLSYLAFTNKVNLLLGMRDLLERFDFYLKFSNEEAWFEEY